MDITSTTTASAKASSASTVTASTTAKASSAHGVHLLLADSFFDIYSPAFNLVVSLEMSKIN